MTIQQLYQLFLQHPVVTTDSRDVPAGSIFFALKGETFDGNQYASAALEQGAAYAVVDDPAVAAGSSMVLVSDVLQALQQLACYHRRQLGTTVIGITGTNGKTTTKDLIASVLKKKYNVLYTQGNFNNHIGVPKTLLQLTADHEMAVIEMGANHPGEIKTLVEIACPDYGIITNVGKAHLEGFGSFEGVIRTKGELYDYLRQHGGTAFINGGNEHLKGISQGLTLVTYQACPNSSESGENCPSSPNPSESEVTGRLIDCNPFVQFGWQASGAEPQTVQTHLIGSYNLDNLLAAACIGTFFGVAPTDISTALGDYQPSNNRSQLTVTADNRLIVDAYNANPTSMAAALDNFSHIGADHKMVILGDMKELGTVSQSEHKKILDKLAATPDIEQIWLVGEEFAKASASSQPHNHTTSRPQNLTSPPAPKGGGSPANAPLPIEEGWGGASNLTTFPDVAAVKSVLQTARKPQGYTILVKGSNSTRLIQLVELL